MSRFSMLVVSGLVLVWRSLRDAKEPSSLAPNTRRLIQRTGDLLYMILASMFFSPCGSIRETGRRSAW
ncbi:Uncharacterized protein HZ326_2044 [Fusarium oxysporum f. sp. albedinis]|nr:Uncharacterized protein HZ326_2044 [Fusarium oxysporum f. sp. albedinis]